MADNKLALRIISPDKASNRDPYKLQKECDMVIIRCETGDMGFLPGRTACAMTLGAGIMRMYSEGSEERMVIFGGIGHLQDDVITILAEGAQWPADIDVAKVNVEIEDLLGRIEATADVREKDLLNRDLRRCKVQLSAADKAQ